MLLAFPSALLAQGSAPGWMATRAEVERGIQSSERFANSPAYGERSRARAAAAAEALRQRLVNGDFRVGDRMLLSVVGTVSLDDTVTVIEGPRIVARGIGEISLQGVLRSELTQRVTAAVVEVVRNGTVTVRPLVRLGVFGSVVNPGYLAVPAETTVDQLLGLAGGPSAEAAPEKFRLVRGDTVLASGSAVLQAIAAGRSVVDLQMRDGDLLVVEPRSPPWDRASTLQLMTIIVGPIITFLLLR
jgi:protein involved in polysaccharide export with SLBB domain